MIDVHAHFLPGVDDGPGTMEESLRMVRLAVADGVRVVCCTSHLSAEDDFEAELKRRQTVREALQAEIGRAGMGLELRCGAEWLLTADLMDAIETCGPEGFLGGSRAFLFEISRFSTPAVVPAFVAWAKRSGLKPLFAHPERYGSVSLQNFEAVLRPVVSSGALLQLTAGSLTGLFGPRVQKLAEAIARRFPRDIVIASDAHESEVRVPGLSQGYAALSRIEPGLDLRARERLASFLGTKPTF